MSALADKLTLDRYAMKDRATSHLRIYVGGLQDGANLEELYEHFIPFGQINGIVINRNFGFVQFQDESSAQEAIIKGNGSMFQGKSLNVKTAQTNLTVEKSRHGDDQMQDMSPAGPLNEKLPMATGDDGNDELYDNFGNYIGDQNYEEYEEGYAGKPGWEGRGGVRGRGLVRGARGRGGRGRGVAPGFRDRSPVAGVRMPVRLPVLFNSPRPPPPPRAASAAGVVVTDWKDRGNFERYQQQMSEYPRALPVTERNDCEIIVVSKSLTEYAEYIEGRLKRLGIVVDLLFPMEDVPIGKVLGNIASRGCLYAILVMPQNQENRSLTLTILHGLPQEHRNMPLEDALQLLSRNFQEVQRGGPSGREAVYALLGQLADGRTLTVMQYDKVIEYLQERREQQVKIELGEPLTTAPSTKTQVDLQQRILSILNDKKVTAPVEPTPPPVAPTPPAPPAQSKLLNDPTVRKALDTILQKFT